VSESEISWLADVRTVVWKEAQEFRQPGGSRWGRATTTVLVFVGVFGVFMPYQFGPEWVTSRTMLVYWAWVPILLVSGVVAQAFAGERERHTLESLLATRLSDSAILAGKVAAVVGYAWGLTMVAMVTGLVTANVAHGEGRLLLFPLDVALGVVLITLLVSTLAAAVGVLISLRAGTVRQAQQTLSLATMVIVFGAIYALQNLNIDWAAVFGEAPAQTFSPALLLLTLVLAAASAVTLWAARIRFQRARLILD
jgi:ABC-2 type transport system permease protein